MKSLGLPGNTGSRSNKIGSGGGRSFREQYVIFAIVFILLFGSVILVVLLPRASKEENNLPSEIHQEADVLSIMSKRKKLSHHVKEGAWRAKMIDRISKRMKHLDDLLDRLGEGKREGEGVEVGEKRGGVVPRIQYDEEKEGLSKKGLQKKIEKNAVKLLSVKRAIEQIWGKEIRNDWTFEELLPLINSGDLTFAWIKPDAFADHSLSRLLSFISPHFDLTSYKVYQMQEKHVESFYEEHIARSFFPKLAEFMTSGPSIALILRKKTSPASANDGEAVDKWRGLIGPTNSETAREVSPHSLRAIFGTDGTRNAFHGSDSIDSVKREINLVFFDPIFGDGVFGF